RRRGSFSEHSLDLVSRRRDDALPCRPYRRCFRQLQNATAQRPYQRTEKVLLRCGRGRKTRGNRPTTENPERRQDHGRNRFSTRRKQPSSSSIATRTQNVQRE